MSLPTSSAAGPPPIKPGIWPIGGGPLVAGSVVGATCSVAIEADPVDGGGSGVAASEVVPVAHAEPCGAAVRRHVGALSSSASVKAEVHVGSIVSSLRYLTNGRIESRAITPESASPLR